METDDPDDDVRYTGDHNDDEDDEENIEVDGFATDDIEDKDDDDSPRNEQERNQFLLDSLLNAPLKRENFNTSLEYDLECCIRAIEIARLELNLGKKSQSEYDEIVEVNELAIQKLYPKKRMYKTVLSCQAKIKPRLTLDTCSENDKLNFNNIPMELRCELEKVLDRHDIILFSRDYKSTFYSGTGKEVAAQSLRSILHDQMCEIIRKWLLGQTLYVRDLQGKITTLPVKVNSAVNLEVKRKEDALSFMNTLGLSCEHVPDIVVTFFNPATNKTEFELIEFTVSNALSLQSLTRNAERKYDKHSKKALVLQWSVRGKYLEYYDFEGQFFSADIVTSEELQNALRICIHHYVENCGILKIEPYTGEGSFDVQSRAFTNLAVNYVRTIPSEGEKPDAREYLADSFYWEENVDKAKATLEEEFARLALKPVMGEQVNLPREEIVHHPSYEFHKKITMPYSYCPWDEEKPEAPYRLPFLVAEARPIYIPVATVNKLTTDKGIHFLRALLKIAYDKLSPYNKVRGKGINQVKCNNIMELDKVIQKFVDEGGYTKMSDLSTDFLHDVGVGVKQIDMKKAASDLNTTNENVIAMGGERETPVYRVNENYTTFAKLANQRYPGFKSYGELESEADNPLDETDISIAQQILWKIEGTNSHEWSLRAMHWANDLLRASKNPNFCKPVVMRSKARWVPVHMIPEEDRPKNLQEFYNDLMHSIATGEKPTRVDEDEFDVEYPSDDDEEGFPKAENVRVADNVFGQSNNMYRFSKGIGLGFAGDPAKIDAFDIMNPDHLRDRIYLLCVPIYGIMVTGKSGLKTNAEHLIFKVFENICFQEYVEKDGENERHLMLKLPEKCTIVKTTHSISAFYTSTLNAAQLLSMCNHEHFKIPAVHLATDLLEKINCGRQTKLSKVRDYLIENPLDAEKVFETAMSSFTNQFLQAFSNCKVMDVVKRLESKVCFFTACRAADPDDPHSLLFLKDAHEQFDFKTDSCATLHFLSETYVNGILNDVLVFAPRGGFDFTQSMQKVSTKNSEVFKVNKEQSLVRKRKREKNEENIKIKKDYQGMFKRP